MKDKKNCDMRCLRRDDPTAQNCEGCAGKKEQPKQEQSVPKWDSDGLPPLGVKCEFTTNAGHNWHETELIFKDGNVVLTSAYHLFKISDPDIAFRLIRTERERDELLAKVAKLTFDLAVMENLAVEMDVRTVEVLQDIMRREFGDDVGLFLEKYAQQLKDKA